MKGTPPIFAANGIRFTLEHFALGGQGGIRTHSPIRNGFTVRRDSPTSPPTHIDNALSNIHPTSILTAYRHR